MAQLTAPEKNALRKAIRLLDNRENKGDPTYDALSADIAANLREMLIPTEKFNILVPEDFPFDLTVVHYETDAAGVKHLWVSAKEHKKEKKRARQQAEA